MPNVVVMVIVTCDSYLKLRLGQCFFEMSAYGSKFLSKFIILQLNNLYLFSPSCIIIVFFCALDVFWP
jgi:hypothetical protein